MKKLIPAVLLAFTSLITLPVAAQYTDSLPTVITGRDSLAHPPINWSTPPAKRVFPYKSFLLPSVLVAYGVVSLKSDELGHINQKVKEEIYTERLPRKVGVDNYLLFVPAAAVYGLNAIGIKGKNNFRDRSMLYGMSQLIMSATVFSVKKITAETRPDASDRLSFPSGHTASAFAAAEFLRQEYKDVSPWYGVAGYAVAATTGYLRISNNKHWMGDVVAGAGVGIISTKLAYWIYPAIKRKLFKDKPVSTIIMPTYQDGAVGLGLVHHF
jgi:membrane-associated phospholipid phosphatase